MKQTTLLLLALALSLNLSAQSSLQTISYASPALSGASIPLHVYLPDGYATSTDSYPLYIFLHGCCGNSPTAYSATFKSRLDVFINVGSVEPMVVAFPSLHGADFGNRHLFTNSIRNGQWGDAVMIDLMGFLNDSFRVARSPGLRAIGGFSMGGDGAWRLGLAHADSFGCILSHGTFPALDAFPPFVPGFLQENGGVAPYTFSPTAGALSAIFYGLSSVWSPNLANMPHRVDLPVKTDGNLDTTVFESWYPIADVNTIIRQTWPTSGPLPQAFYSDVGLQMPLLLPSNQLFEKQMDTLTQDGYSFVSKALFFNEGHTLSQRRIDSSLIWLSQQFRKHSTALERGVQELNFRLIVQTESGYLQIVNQFKSEKTSHISLLNLEGKVLLKKTLSRLERNHKLTLESLSPGVYILQIRQDNRIGVKKFLWK